MGIHGLWEVIMDKGESKSLLKYTAAQTHSLRAHGLNRMIRVGVDLSPLMAECVMAASAPLAHGRFTGAEIYILFNKLTAFLCCPAVFIFVLDGDGRPSVKRNTKVVNNTPHWKNRAVEIIQHCGYYIHEAPGEAEAELAAMNIHGIIDAVITVDSDAFAFGAMTLLRSLSSSRRVFDDEHTLFTQNEAGRVANLTRGGYILFALLVGGDYGAGLSGFGPVTAYALAQGRFGDDLLHAVETLAEQPLKLFLEHWRQSIRTEMQDNTSGRFRKLPPANLVLLLDESFPDLNIVNLYLEPLTSWSSPSTGLTGNSSIWLHREPNIEAIAAFCANRFDWDTGAILNAKFASRLWGPIFLQCLYSKYRCYDPERKLLASPFNNAHILDFTLVMRKGKFALAMEDEPMARLKVSTSTFIGSLGPKYCVDTAEAVKSVIVYAPKLLLPSTLRTSDFTKGKKKTVATNTPGGAIHPPVNDSHIKRTSANQKQKAQRKGYSAAKNIGTHYQPVRNATPGPSSARHQPVRNATPGPSSTRHQPERNATPGPSSLQSLGMTSLSDFVDGNDLLWTLEDSESDVDVEFPPIEELFRTHLYNKKTEDASGGDLALQHPDVIDLTQSDGEADASEPQPRRSLGFLDLTASDDEDKQTD